ncbi:MAG: O-antigen ligase family protein [Flavobacteriaceae bacterium]
MKLHRSVYRTIFLSFIIVQAIFPRVEITVALSGVLLFVLLTLEPLKLSRSLSIALTYLLAIVGIGVLSSVFYEYEFFDRLRDLVHFMKPVLLMFLAYLLVVRINNTRFVLRLIVFLGVFLALKHIITLGIVDLPSELQIDRIRAKAGAGNFLELLALIILLAFRKQAGIVGPNSRKLFITILSISFVLYFSRTMILGLIVFLLSIYGFTKLTRKAFEYIIVVIFLFGLFFAYLFTLDLNQDQQGINKFLFKIKNSPAEIFASPENYDPRNHKEIFKHWRGYEAGAALSEMKENPANYVVGKGFGALVDLGFKAPVGGENGLRYIPHLHNGYIYVFLKTGVIGLVLYLVLLFNMYKQAYFKSISLREKAIRNIISGFGVYFLASSLVITGLYNLGEISIFFLGMFYALAQLEVAKNKKELDA